MSLIVNTRARAVSRAKTKKKPTVGGMYIRRKGKTMNSNQKQCNRILSYLEQNDSITSLEALKELGIFRLASRISELKHKYGYDIKDEWIKITNRYGEECRIKRYLKPETKWVIGKGQVKI